jgi:hypothetical protein
MKTEMKEFEILPGGKPLFTPEEYQKFREEFCEEMEQFRREWRLTPSPCEKEDL